MRDEAIDSIIERLDRIENLLKVKQRTTGEVFLDNAEFLHVMNISKRTAADWRSKRIISYSQIQGKIFYRMKDIHIMLKKYYHNAEEKKYNGNSKHLP